MRFPDTAACERPVDFALAYASDGIPTFPVQMDPDENGKYSKRPHPMLNGAPRGEGGHHQATTDLAQIRRWWGEDPTAAIGWFPGGCNLVVLDADGPEGVRELYDASGGYLDNTTTVQIRTSGKGGGRHIVFDRSHIEGTIGNGSLVGVTGEARGDKGYAMLPDGRDYYTLDSDTLEIAPLPAWAEHVLPPPRNGDARTPITDVTSDDEQVWIEEHSAPEHSAAAQRILKDAATSMAQAVEGDAKLGRHPTMASVVGTVLSYAQNHSREINLSEARSDLRSVFLAEFLDMSEAEERGKDFDRFWSAAIALRAAEDGERDPPFGNAEEFKAFPFGLRFNESENSSRLIHLHGDRLRFVSRWGRWIVWESHTWQLDDRNVAVTELAKDVSRALYLQASKTRDTDMADKIARLAKASASRSGISAMIELARGIPGVPVLHSALDTDPWLLGVRNGVIDLRTGQRRDGDPEDLMIMQASVNYDPAAKCPTWDKCLRDWFPDSEVRDYVQRVAGQAVVGEQRDHILVIHYGDGGNGKGTFVRALGHVFGDYFVVPHKALLVEQKHGVHDTEKAVLFRKRLAVAVESDHRQKLNEAEIKNLTGGDTISARRMREDPWDFVPSHSLWLQTNYLPEIQGRDAGIWRRIRLVEWKQHFDGKQKDDTLDEKLRAETSGILNWLIAGCLAWNAKGLTEPPAVVRSTSQYRRAEDVLARFADDLDFVFQDGVAISSAHLAEAISQWCVDEGIGKAPSANEIASWLKSNGATRDRRRVFGEKNKRTVWDGAGFVNAATPDS